MSSKLIPLVAVALLTLIAPAQADGLFGGKRGLIRGDVGRLLDPVEKKVLTPAARGATKAATTAIGTTVGAFFGAPHVGGYVGGYVGDTINQRAAGASPAMGRPMRYPQQAPLAYDEPSRVRTVGYGQPTFRHSHQEPQIYGDRYPSVLPYPHPYRHPGFVQPNYRPVFVPYQGVVHQGPWHGQQMTGIQHRRRFHR